MTNKIGLSILISIILTVIVISLVNVGISVFMEQPNYSDYCKFQTQEIISSETRCVEVGGLWNSEGKTYPSVENSIPINGYCDIEYTCRGDWESSMKKYNQNRYYILAGIGFILLIFGLFVVETMMQITGLATGGILVAEGIVTNLENKVVVFVSLLAILIIFGILAYRIIRKK